MLVSSRHDNAAVQKLMLCLRPGNTVLTENLPFNNNNNMKQKIVVFGATGNLGAYIAVHLNEQGYEVIAVGHRKSDNNFF